MQYNAIFKTVVKTDKLYLKASGAPVKVDSDDEQPPEDDDGDALLVEPGAANTPAFPLEMHPRAKRNNNSIPGALS